MKFSTTLFIVFAALVMIHAAPLGRQDFTKNIHKEFSVNADATIDLINKYGNVNIETTTGSNVVIDVDIVVKASSEDKANDIFERIDVDFSNSSNYVKAETVISSKNSGWFNRWWSSGSKNSYKINYTVKMPASCELKLTNKYGDSFVDDIRNRATVNIKYGAIEMKNVEGKLDMEVKYGKGSVGNVGDADLDFGYSKLRMENAGDLRLHLSYSSLNMGQANEINAEMKYSNLRIMEAGAVDCESKYDDIEIESVGEFGLHSKYTSVDIQKLQKGGSVNMGYGGLKIHDLANSFESFDIETNYTGVKIYIDSDTHFSIDAETQYAPVKAPDLNTTVDIRKNNSTTLKGYYGSQSGGTITAKMKYGSLTINK